MPSLGQLGDKRGDTGVRPWRHGRFAGTNFGRTRSDHDLVQRGWPAAAVARDDAALLRLGDSAQAVGHNRASAESRSRPQPEIVGLTAAASLLAAVQLTAAVMALTVKGPTADAAGSGTLVASLAADAATLCLAAILTAHWWASDALPSNTEPA